MRDSAYSIIEIVQMRGDTDDLLIEKCRRLVEEKLGWGSSEYWTHHDFELLGERISGATGVNLSVATLKRLWGKVKYSSKPTVTTLDILARFIGYTSWREFQSTQVTASTEVVEQSSRVQQSPPEIYYQATSPRIRPVVMSLFVGALGFLVLGFVFLSARKGENRSLAAEEFYFASKKVVSEGVPNSVIFEYNAKAAGEEDSIFIQQSWDKNLRQQVSRGDNNATSIYYYPGFFQAKLVIGERVVKEHGLFIKTNGWLPLIEQQDVPVYFSEKDALRKGVLTLPVKRIVSSGVPLQPATPWVSFHNAREFGGLQSDNFIFETSLKNDYNEGTGVCQLSEIHIRFEGGLYLIPLSIKGCVSKLEIFDVEGKKNDPSPLGCELSDWVNVRLEVIDRKGSLFINGNKTFDLNYDIPPSKIVALQYRFQGTGSVDHVMLSTVANQIVYRDDF